MKFQSYLNESERTSGIEKEKAYELIKNNCKGFLKHFLKGNIINRGYNTIDDLYVFGDSMKGSKRVSMNTKNYYTLMIDNFKSWKSFPKRSRSFICGTYDTYYSDNYYVLPYDDSIIGQCPATDLWDSFDEIIQSGDNMDDFNYNLESIFGHERPKTFIELKKVFDNIQKNTDFSKTNHYNWTANYFLKYIENNVYKKMTFLEWIEKLINPKTNGFKLCGVNNFPEKNKEVWFSGKAVFINFKTDFIKEASEIL